MTARKAIASALLEPGLKVRDTDWHPTYYIYFSIDSECFLDVCLK